jgi:autotransporter-associated beta strand protein
MLFFWFRQLEKGKEGAMSHHVPRRFRQAEGKEKRKERPMPHRTLNLTLASSLALTAAAALLATPAALAGTLSWDPGLTPLTPSGGDGTWDLSTTANWSNGATDVQWTDTTGGTDTATFANTAGTVTLDTTLGARGLQFSTTGYSVTGSGTLTLGAGGIDATSLTSGTTTLGFSNLTLASGQSWNVGGGGTLAVNAAVAAHTTGVTLAINNSTSNGSGVYSSTSLANTNGILGPWASYGSGTSLKYATISSGTISGLTGTAAATAAALTDTTGTVNYDLASATGATPATVSANTIRYTGGWQTLAPGATSFTINGLMNAGTGLLTVGTNPITIGANKELVILGNTQAITITSDILNNGGGASAVTYNGGGTLTLTGAKSFTGGLFVTAGTVTGNNAGSFGTGTITLGGSGNVTFAPAQVTTTNAISLTPGATGTIKITAGGNGAATLSGPISLNGSDLTLEQSGGNGSGGPTITGGITGTGNLILNNSGAGDHIYITTNAVDNGGTITNQGAFAGNGVNISANIGANVTDITQNAALQPMTLSGTNLQSGKVLVQAGVLDFAKKASLYNSTTASWTVSNIDVKSGATLMVGYSGGSTFLAADVDTLLDGTHLGASTASSGLESGAFLGLDINQGGWGATYTYGSNIVNPNSGTNVLGVRVSGGSSNILTFTGTGSSYTGATILGGGANLRVSKLDNGGNASGVGASTNAAANLVIGQSSSLTYTGSGDSTDRLMTLGPTGAFSVIGPAIINTGTGALSFTNTGAVAFTGALPPFTTQNFTLGGTNTGSNTFAPVIGDNGASATSFIKSGTGTWVLSGANSYTGATDVNGGTLLVNGNQSAATGAVTVKNTATLGGSGTLGGAVTVQAGGKLAPGTSPGQLTVGSLTLTSTGAGSTTQMEIGGATLGTGYDNVTVTTAGGLTYGGLLDIVSYGSYNVAAQSGSYELFTFTGGYAGEFGTVTVDGFSLTGASGVWSGTNAGMTYTFTDSTGVLQVVPEPAALALLCLGAVGLLRSRRGPAVQAVFAGR